MAIGQETNISDQKHSLQYIRFDFYTKKTSEWIEKHERVPVTPESTLFLYRFAPRLSRAKRTSCPQHLHKILIAKIREKFM